MARLLVKTPDIAPAEIPLYPGCNRVGREGDVEILFAHPSVSRHHCEVWLTEDAVLVRDLDSRNGTFVEGHEVREAQLFAGQILRVGDVEMMLADAPARISVPELPRYEPKTAARLADGTLCCFRHDEVAASLQCTKCERPFCGKCVRELRVAGHSPRRFCPECGGQCERLGLDDGAVKRNSWLSRIVDAFTKPPTRR